MAKKLHSIKVEDADWEQWQRNAEAAGQGVSEWIRERCNQNSDVQRVEVVSVEKRSTSAPERPKSRKLEFAESVAGRTGHDVGCACFQCVQAERFFKSVRRDDGT
jgi:hypothetical protein